MPINPAIFAGPARNYTRDGSAEPLITEKSYIVIHNTSNPRDAPARDEASYSRNRTDGTSSHYYGDRAELIQMLDTDWRAQHVGSKPGNDRGISYELTGKNHYTRDWWLANIAWERLAAQIAADCRHHRIEPQTLEVIQIKAGTLSGIITHDQARLAWGGTDHTDPGPHFPMDHLIAMVRAALTPPVPPQPEPPLPPAPPVIPAPPDGPVAPPPPLCPPVPESGAVSDPPLRVILSMLWRAVAKRPQR